MAQGQVRSCCSHSFEPLCHFRGSDFVLVKIKYTLLNVDVRMWYIIIVFQNIRVQKHLLNKTNIFLYNVLNLTGRRNLRFPPQHLFKEPPYIYNTTPLNKTDPVNKVYLLHFVHVLLEHSAEMSPHFQRVTISVRDQTTSTSRRFWKSTCSSTPGWLRSAPGAAGGFSKQRQAGHLYWPQTSLPVQDNHNDTSKLFQKKHAVTCKFKIHTKPK